jgi:predicted nucleic acid-binding protein
MILDTNALCAFVDGEAAIAEALRESSRVAIPVIVLGEFRYAVAPSRHRAAYEAWLDAHLASFDVLAVTEETAIPYAALRVALRRAGQPIPANDTWIAALAIQHRMPVVSRDRHFDAVPGIERREW